MQIRQLYVTVLLPKLLRGDPFVIVTTHGRTYEGEGVTHVKEAFSIDESRRLLKINIVSSLHILAAETGSEKTCKLVKIMNKWLIHN